METSTKEKKVKIKVKEKNGIEHRKPATKEVGSEDWPYNVEQRTSGRQPHRWPYPLMSRRRTQCPTCIHMSDPSLQNAFIVRHNSTIPWPCYAQAYYISYFLLDRATVNPAEYSSIGTPSPSRQIELTTLINSTYYNFGAIPQARILRSAVFLSSCLWNSRDPSLIDGRLPAS